MAVAKVILNNNTLMDATVATATASDIMSSKTAMLANGVMTTGTGSGGGGDDRFAEIIGRTISGSYENSNITNVGPHAFYECRNLTAISLSNTLSIGSSAFANCSALTSVSFHNCLTIGSFAFASCSSLSSISFPNCSTISMYAFRGCSSLSSISFPQCRILSGTGIFSGCSLLTSVTFPRCTNITNGVFSGCSNLESAFFPECVSIGIGAFQSLYALTDISFPKCVSVWQSAFQACSALTSVRFPQCASISMSAFTACQSLTTAMFSHSSASAGILSYAFRICYNLLSLYLFGSVIYVLNALNAFQNTPIYSTTTSTGGIYGSIFVPESLYSTYISATNWATLSSRFVSLTDAQIAALNF